MHLAVEVVAAMGMAEGQGGDEDRQEAVGLDHLGQAIGHEGRRQGDQPVACLRELSLSRDAEGGPAEGRLKTEFFIRVIGGPSP